MSLINKLFVETGTIKQVPDKIFVNGKPIYEVYADGKLVWKKIQDIEINKINMHSSLQQIIQNRRIPKHRKIRFIVPRNRTVSTIKTGNISNYDVTLVIEAGARVEGLKNQPGLLILSPIKLTNHGTIAGAGGQGGKGGDGQTYIYKYQDRHIKARGGAGGAGGDGEYYNSKSKSGAKGGPAAPELTKYPSKIPRKPNYGGNGGHGGLFGQPGQKGKPGGGNDPKQGEDGKQGLPAIIGSAKLKGGSKTGKLEGEIK
jgi:hypothetical protein